MSDVTPIERVIASPGSASVPAFPLDQPHYEITITSRGQSLGHRLQKPTDAQLYDRESQLAVVSESVSDSEEAVRGGDDDEIANARLWDVTATHVKGYRLPGEPKEAAQDWREVTDDLRLLIPAAHKSTAFRGMYQSAATVEENTEEGFLLGSSEWVIRQVYGHPDDPLFVVRHTLRAPTEKERREYRQKATEIRFGKGQRKQTTKVLAKLKPNVELYDALFVSIDGATVNGHSFVDNSQRRSFLELIDPISKRQVITVFLKAFEAQLQD